MTTPDTTTPDTTTPDTASAATRRPASPAVSIGMVVAILLIAANLRITLTAVGTLLPDIERGTGLTPSWGGLLSTMPLLTFAATSPLVGRASHRFGTARLLVLALAVLAAGTVVRSLPPTACLFVGTVLLSAAIACGNVLLPAVVRRHIPGPRIPLVSALYATVMSLLAAVSSGVAVPMAHALPGGWRTSLAWGVIFALAALPVWLPRVRSDRPAAVTGTAHTPTPWRSGLAWQVSFYMGLQSLNFYTTVAWLPSILARHGTSSTAAGWLLFYFQVVALLSGILLPVLARGRQDQRATAAAASVVVAAGFALLIPPGLAIPACTLLGLGGGACFVLALSFQSQRARGPGEATALAGMAQSVGYLVAATGPLVLGIVHDASHDWAASLALLIGLSLAMTAAGYGAGRNRLIAGGA